MKKVLDFGKNKGKKLEDCEKSYILWLALHKKVLNPCNQWAADLATEILMGPTKEAKVALEMVNNMYKCLLYARYEYERRNFQAELDIRIAYLKDEWGHDVYVKHHEYVFA